MSVKLNNDNYYYDILRKNIRKYRKLKKYTQQQLADLTFLSVDYICEIESLKKKKSFSIVTLGRIADAMEIDIREFFDKSVLKKIQSFTLICRTFYFVYKFITSLLLIILSFMLIGIRVDEASYSIDINYNILRIGKR